jgi:hypothetical protein
MQERFNTVLLQLGTTAINLQSLRVLRADIFFPAPDPRTILPPMLERARHFHRLLKRH